VFNTPMQTDIASRADIDALMISFYGRAMKDPVIGHLFTHVAQLDLAHHLPVIGDFWEATLFGTGNYARHRRNPLLIHAELDRQERLEPHHFRRWLELFTESVDEAFAGAYAEFAKHRGQAIARRMQEFLAAGR
jgi:hemoglobin